MMENVLPGPQTPKPRDPPQTNKYNDLHPILQRAPSHVMSQAAPRCVLSGGLFGAAQQEAPWLIKASNTISCTRHAPRRGVVDGQKVEWPSRPSGDAISPPALAFVNPSTFFIGCSGKCIVLRNSLSMVAASLF